MQKICPCGSQLSYETCCGIYISGKQLPPSPEALMRSRYTAYTRANITYIVNTMRGKASEDYDPVDARKWAQSVRWVGLQVIEVSPVSADTTQGYVEFIAKYQQNGNIYSSHETSEFQFIDGRWYYVAGLLHE